MLNTALFYAILAMAEGVFYREFTKFSGFDSFAGKTTLSVVHTHFFLLGMVAFLLAALFDDRLDLERSKKYRIFYPMHNLGVLVTGGLPGL